MKVSREGEDFRANPATHSSCGDPFNPYPLGPVLANVSRPDVDSYFGISGDHGFDIQLPTYFQDGLQHTVEVYGVHPSGGYGPLIGSATFLWPKPRPRPVGRPIGP